MKANQAVTGMVAGAVALLALCAPIAVQAQCIADINGRMLCPPPEASCVKDRYGAVVCSPSKGAITFDRHGEPVCGPGACVRDIHGEFACSSSPGGSAAIDISSKAVCTDGCTRASASYCVRPR